MTVCLRILSLAAALMAVCTLAPAAGAQTDVVYTFANAAEVQGGSAYQFDILAAPTKAGSRIGDLLFYVDYDAASFGSSIVSGGGATITAGAPISDTGLYTVRSRDHGPNRLAISVEYLDPGTPANGTAWSTAPEPIVNVTLEMNSTSSSADLSFDTPRMSGQQYESDPAVPFGNVTVGPSNRFSPVSSAPDWSVNPPDFASTVTLVGAVTLDGTSADDPDDILAAFAGDEVRGVTESIEVGSMRLFFLTIYANGNGETISFKAYDADEDTVVSLDETVVFTADDVHGTIPSPFALSGSQAEQTISLTAGWNLISLTVTPSDTSPGSVFGTLGNNLQYVTGFSGGATFYNPDGLAFLNTLTAIESGLGYWVKVAADDEFTVTGQPLANNFSLTLDTGWNLIGYWPENNQSPASVFSSLITANKLLFVTGFSSGSNFFDPSGLSFLNTLSALKRGRGYWVKVASTVTGFTYPSTPGPATFDTPASDAVAAKAVATRSSESFVRPTSRYMFVGGQVAGAAGRQAEDITFVTDQGRIVGRGRADARGRLAATPVYGDDPTTPIVDGARDGDEIFARIGDRQLSTGIVFAADMNLRHVDLRAASASPEIPVSYSLEQGYPNPFAESMHIRVGVPEPSQARLEVYDLLGRRVKTLFAGDMEAGYHDVRLEASGLANGAYFVVFEAGGFRASRSAHVVKQGE